MLLTGVLAPGYCDTDEFIDVAPPGSVENDGLPLGQEVWHHEDGGLYQY